ncbi:MAG: hypothetical protein GPOALKHO_001101 [Sodalis sp.]|nr:MAG: hypothetical protein GPOALKHO_001101 [Sodalis sp.]
MKGLSMNRRALIKMLAVLGRWPSGLPGGGAQRKPLLLIVKNGYKMTI